MRDFIDITTRLDEDAGFSTISRVYRGSQNANPDAFSDTRLGKPTFTDVFGIAFAYAENGGAVFAYDISPRTPLVFEDSGDPFYNLKDIVDMLGLSMDEVGMLIPGVRELKRASQEENGEPEQVHLSDWKQLATDEEREAFIGQTYALTHQFIDSTFFQECCLKHYHDCIIYRGWFTSGQPPYEQPGDSWDGDTALEWRPLVPSIVKLVGEVTPDDFD
jgi:hypothetical protein